MRPVSLRIALLGLFLLASASDSLPRSPRRVTIPTPDHVVIVLFENHSYSDIIGSSSAPYINSLASAGANFTNSYAVTHPSQPNYLAFFSGSTQGVTGDSTPPAGSPYAGPDLAGALIAAGHTFGGYSEDMPSVGYTGSSYLNYVRKHNPWVDFSDVPSSLNMPYTDFPAAGSYSSLPTVSIVVPNLMDDMHDGTITDGDTWLSTHLDAYKTWAAANNSLLILTWDEDDYLALNQIPTIFVGPMVAAGLYGESIDHFAVLRTICDMYGAAPPNAAAAATPITDCWVAPSSGSGSGSGSGGSTSGGTGGTGSTSGSGSTPAGSSGTSTSGPSGSPACGLLGLEALAFLALIGAFRRL